MKKSYPWLILEDKFIRDFITAKFPRSAIAQILIFRTLDYTKIEIHTASTKNLSVSSHQNIENKPSNKSKETISLSQDSDGLSGLNLKNLQENLQIALKKYKRATLLFANPKLSSKFSTDNTDEEKNNLSHQSNITVGIMVKQLKQPFQYASIFAKYLATQLEKRENTVKQALNRSLRLIQNYDLQGIKIKVSGRLNGVDMAEQESIFKGRIPLSNILANIDYACESSKTLYGILGVKVWIYRNNSG